MNLNIYLLNYNDISLEDLLASKYFTDADRLSFEEYKLESVKKEKIASMYLKNKYIGSYYLNENSKPLSKEKFFNISHSHGYIALVIDTAPVGIDIEKIRPVDNELKNYISNELERQYIRDEQSFYEIWTNKEALVKANGLGIKQKVNTIIGLPINGVREFLDKAYYNKTIKYLDYVISVSREGNDDYSLELIDEDYYG